MLHQSLKHHCILYSLQESIIRIRVDISPFFLNSWKLSSQLFDHLNLIPFCVN